MTAEPESRRTAGLSWRLAALLVALGVIAGLLCAGGLALWDANRRAQLLAELDFRTQGPSVPTNVLDSVRGAELHAYRDMGPLRKAAEDLQDALALLSPQLAFSRDFSLGPYRIKASTVRETLDFALARGFLTLRSERSSRYNEVLPYFALQPSLNDWEAGVLLEYLRERHPQLARMSWEQISRDPEAIAKLYSGYMGAGGDWAAWASSMTPGAVSRSRLGYDPTTGGYARVFSPS